MADKSVIITSNYTFLQTLIEVINDEYLIFLCTFLTEDETNTNLKSYIKYEFTTKGLSDKYELLFPNDKNIQLKKHTVIELTSELQKCNLTLYINYKFTQCYNKLNYLLESNLHIYEIEYTICNIAYQMISDRVVICSKTLWYFDNNIWQESSYDSYLWNFITTDIINFILEHDPSSDNKVIFHIKSVAARTRIIKDLNLRLQDDSFEKKLDYNSKIISMQNGILNTETAILSDPVPSDYVSIKTGVPYITLDKQSEKLSTLIRILSSIFPKKQILNFFITSCATFLEGYNLNKVFYIWWGTGNNAKSLVQSLIMKAFGEYCSTAPTSLITGRRTSSSNATPELCHVEKKLVVFLQEPNPDEKIRAGVVKELTGNDRLYTRQLFKSGKTMIFKSKLVFVCNNILDIPRMDAALRRRIVVLPFIRTFLSEKEYNTRKQKGTLQPQCRIIDPNIEKTLLDCSDVFMSLICKRYFQFKHEPFVIPNIIQDYTEEYIIKNNYSLTFIKSFVELVSGSYTAISDIYELFKDWFSRSYPGKRVADLDIFTTELENEGYVNNEGIVEAFVNYNNYMFAKQNE